tara:strand:+ start:347 stop:817 length:471 start_codon:yes stop_codon:yes gene_type:complete
VKQFRYATTICFLALLLSPESLPGAERMIGAASSLTTIFPETPLAADAIDREMTLKAAQGEAESGQVVIVAGDQALKIKRVEVSDLRKGGERISSDMASHKGGRPEWKVYDASYGEDFVACFEPEGRPSPANHLEMTSESGIDFSLVTVLEVVKTV